MVTCKVLHRISRSRYAFLLLCLIAVATQMIGQINPHTVSVGTARSPTHPSPTTPTTTPTHPSTTPPTVPSTPTPTVIGLRIVNAPQIVRSETPHKFSAVADYSDGSSSDVSKSVTWTGNSSVVFVSSEGTAFCNTSGSAGISAQLNSRSATVPFTCLLKQIVPAPGFAEHAQQFDGPFASWVNVKTVFGAKGDGTTDDTAALQNALNSLVSQPAVLWIPKGTYVISGTLHVTTAQRYSIIGEDPGNTLIEWHGPAGQTMMDIEGCSWFRVARLSWNGMDAAAVAIRIATTFQNGESYPTFDEIEDQKISRVGIGLQIGFAGETSIQRVHFDRNTKAGISLEDWDALNFNVVDSLFTDCALGVTNIYGAGAFNVSNSVFVRSTTADMMMGNTGPFSERQNLSFDSQAFFIAGGIGASSNVILQANTIINPITTPIQIANPGPIMLIDNRITSSPSTNILLANGYNGLGIFSMGNEFTAVTPFAGNLGQVTSIDEAATLSDPTLALTIPTDVYVPVLSSRQIFEIPAGSPSSAIQQIINEAAAVLGGAVVHFPSLVFQIDQTINIPDSQNLSIVGDGPLTVLSGSINLVGPLVKVTGTHVRLENMRFTVSAGSSAEADLEIDVDDLPSTAVHCDQCKTQAQNGVQINGLDNALVDFRIATLNATVRGGLVTGGATRNAGYQTLGRVDGFMTSIDTYGVANGGRFLVEDGWHDVGQGSVQFALTGSGMVTQQGGTVYTQSTSGMTAQQFSGRVSLLGITTDSIFNIDSGSDMNAMAIGTVQITGGQIIDSESAISKITELSNYSLMNNGSPIAYSDVPSQPSTVEYMFSQARTDYVVPRVVLSTSAVNINLHRILTDGPVVGIIFTPKQQAQDSGTYSIVSSTSGGMISSPNTLTCPNGDISLSGRWSLQGDEDGFYGLKRQGLFLSNRTTPSSTTDRIGLFQTMSDAGQRWMIRPTGDGFFNIINRANGEMLTNDGKGCAALSTENDTSAQEWAVNLLKAAAN